MIITLHWWMWLLLPLSIFLMGLLWSGRTYRNDTGMSSGMESAFIFLGTSALSVALAAGILIGHFS